MITRAFIRTGLLICAVHSDEQNKSLYREKVTVEVLLNMNGKWYRTSTSTTRYSNYVYLYVQDINDNFIYFFKRQQKKEGKFFVCFQFYRVSATVVDFGIKKVYIRIYY